MSDKKIIDLTEDTSPTSTDILPMVDVSTLITKKVKLDNLPISAASQTALNSKANASDFSNVNNTSDASKPVSTAQQSALDLKEALLNKATNLSSPDDIKYPTVQAVVTALQSVLNSSIQGASNIIWCLDNGIYASGQAAVDAAADGDLIVFGPKAGLVSWGDLNIPAGKKLSLVGLEAPYSPLTIIGSITFSPTTGTNVNDNEISLVNLYLNPSSGNCLTMGGTAPARVRIHSCIAAPIASAFSVSNSNVQSSLYLEDVHIEPVISPSSPLLDITNMYVSAKNVEFNKGSVAVRINSGTLEIFNGKFDYNQASEIIQLNGGTFVCGAGTLIRNKSTSGDAIKMTNAGAIAFLSGVSFDVAVGASNYCARGTGVLLYGGLVFNDSAAAAGNKKFQNTLTALPLTTSPTSAA